MLNLARQHRLCQDAVHAALQGALDVGLFCVARHCKDQWLLMVELAVELPDLVCGLVTIHYWHVAVHKYDVVRIVRRLSHDLPDGFFSVVGFVGLALGVNT